MDCPPKITKDLPDCQYEINMLADFCNLDIQAHADMLVSCAAEAGAANDENVSPHPADYNSAEMTLRPMAHFASPLMQMAEFTEFGDNASPSPDMLSEDQQSIGGVNLNDLLFLPGQEFVDAADMRDNGAFDRLDVDTRGPPRGVAPGSYDCADMQPSQAHLMPFYPPREFEVAQGQHNAPHYFAQQLPAGVGADAMAMAMQWPAPQGRFPSNCAEDYGLDPHRMGQWMENQAMHSELNGMPRLQTNGLLDSDTLSPGLMTRAEGVSSSVVLQRPSLHYSIDSRTDDERTDENKKMDIGGDDDSKDDGRYDHVKEKDINGHHVSEDTAELGQQHADINEWGLKMLANEGTSMEFHDFSERNQQ